MKHFRNLRDLTKQQTQSNSMKKKRFENKNRPWRSDQSPRPNEDPPSMEPSASTKKEERDTTETIRNSGDKRGAEEETEIKKRKTPFSSTIRRPFFPSEAGTRDWTSRSNLGSRFSNVGHTQKKSTCHPPRPHTHKEKRKCEATIKTFSGFF